MHGDYQGRDTHERALRLTGLQSQAFANEAL